MSDVTIVSLAPYPVFGVEREEGHYRLRGRDENERFVTLRVSDGKTMRDFGEGFKDPATTPGRAIAEDLIRGVKEHGVFIIDGETPSEEQLAEAEEELKKTYAEWIREADGIWAKTHDVSQITMHQRMAAQALNVRRDWASSVTSRVPCRSCHELVFPNVPKCPFCQAILNWDLARDFGILTPEQEKYGIQRGFLTALDAAPPLELPEPEEVTTRSRGRK